MPLKRFATELRILPSLFDNEKFIVLTGEQKIIAERYSIKFDSCVPGGVLSKGKPHGNESFKHFKTK